MYMFWGCLKCLRKVYFLQNLIGRYWENFLNKINLDVFDLPVIDLSFLPKIDLSFLDLPDIDLSFMPDIDLSFMPELDLGFIDDLTLFDGFALL